MINNQIYHPTHLDMVNYWFFMVEQIQLLTCIFLILLLDYFSDQAIHQISEVMEVGQYGNLLHMSRNGENSRWIIEQQRINVSGFDGNKRESTGTITLKTGYKPYMLHIGP